MGAMSIGHWLIVFVVVMLFFGPKKLGSLGKSLGEGLKGFRDAIDDKGPRDGTPEPKKLARDATDKDLRAPS